MEENRIDRTFAALKAKNRPGLISYIMAGDPDMETSEKIMKTLAESGADLIELGMPFTDPMADGPVIQLAAQRSLSAGTTLKGVLQMVQRFRGHDPDTPVILMGYYNPIYIYGTERFTKDAAAAGVDGFLIVDVPPEEAEELHEPAKTHGLHLIHLMAPTTDEDRMRLISAKAGGFIYYVSVAGITGTDRPEIASIEANLSQIRKCTPLPIAVGFGIKTPKDVSETARIADAVVVGSSIVSTIASCHEPGDAVTHVADQVKALASAL